MAKRAAVLRSSRSLPSATASRSSSSSSRKTLLAVLNHIPSSSKPSSSSSSTKTLTFPFPNLSICHACGTRTRGAPLQTLASHWRVVLLCSNCLSSLDSSDICAYCFSMVSISASDGLDCRSCNRRVHRRCLSLLPPPNSPFTCVDCWLPPKSRSNCPKIASRNPSQIAMLEDVVKDVRVRAERAVATAARARERAVKKAAVARRATELARSALGMAVIVAREEGRPSGAVSVVDDKELAVRLHRAMNSSPRISKILGVGSEKKLCNGYDLDSYSICGKVFENSDKRDVDPLFGFSALDRNLNVELDGMRTTNMRVNGKMTGLDNEGMENGVKDGGVESFRRGQEVGPVEKLERPMKEEQGSCSTKIVNSIEDDNGVEDMDSSKCSGTLCQPGDDGNSSTMQKKRCFEPDRYLITYSKRRSLA